MRILELRLKQLPVRACTSMPAAVGRVADALRAGLREGDAIVARSVSSAGGCVRGRELLTDGDSLDGESDS